MGKEIYLDPIEFQNQLSSFGEGSEEISGVNISEIKDAKKETKLDSIDKLDGLIDELSNAMKKYAQMISTDKDAMDKIAATIQKMTKKMQIKYRINIEVKKYDTFN